MFFSGRKKLHCGLYFDGDVVQKGSIFLETGKHFRPQPAVLSLGLAGCTLTFAALYTCNLC